MVHVDRFGNLVSDIGRDLWDREIAPERGQNLRIRIGEWIGRTLHRTYADAPPGETLALFGSLGYLEVGVNGGSAAERLRLTRGASILISY